MNRPFFIIVLLCFLVVVFAQNPVDVVSQEIPRHSTPQNEPCADQPKSLDELINAFNSGEVPSSSEVSGAWVAIGFARRGGSSSFNCSGVTRGQTFEWVMVANQYVVEIDMIGVYAQTTTLTPDNRENLALTVDFQGDSNYVYRCRLTEQGTLACLLGKTNWMEGVEFKKMPVKGIQRANHKEDAP